MKVLWWWCWVSWFLCGCFLQRRWARALPLSSRQEKMQHSKSSRHNYHHHHHYPKDGNTMDQERGEKDSSNDIDDFLWTLELDDLTGQGRSEEEDEWFLVHVLHERILTQTGLLAVSSPSVAQNRALAMEQGLCQCHSRLVRAIDAHKNSLSHASNIQQVTLLPTSITTRKEDENDTTQFTTTSTTTTIRTTIATSTAGAHSPLPLTTATTTTSIEDSSPSLDQNPPHALDLECGPHVVQAMEDLRDDVAVVTNAFVQALDRLLLILYRQQAQSMPGRSKSTLPPPLLLRNAYQGSYPTLASIQAAAMHLEHFHIYNTTTTTSSTTTTPTIKSSLVSTSSLVPPQQPTMKGTTAPEEQVETNDLNVRHHRKTRTAAAADKDDTYSSSSFNTLDWHIDAGLFLSFVPAQNCAAAAGGGGRENDFLVEDPNDDAAMNSADKEEAFWWWSPTLDRPMSQPLPNNVVMIMLGAGAQHWLHIPSSTSASSSSSTSPWKATRHAVRLMSPPQSPQQLAEPKESHYHHHQIRAWYGMMTMVPDIAIVQENPDRTLADMKQQMSLIMAEEDNNTAAYMTIGCGSHSIDNDLYEKHEEGHDDDNETNPHQVPGTDATTRRRRMMQVMTAQACNNETNFFCWMSCLDIPNARQIEKYEKQGYSLYCMDPQIFHQSSHQVDLAVQPCGNGWVNNPECVGKWAQTSSVVPAYDLSIRSSSLPKSSSKTTPSRPYSHNDDDDDDDDDDDKPIQSIFDPEKEEEPKEESLFCYGGTSMYMGGFAWMRPTCVIYLFPHWVLRTRLKFLASCVSTGTLGCALEWILRQRRQTIKAWANSPGLSRLALLSSLYAIQLIMGYLLMLVIMTYNGFLFLFSILGLVGGHILFNSKDVVYLWRPKSAAKNALSSSLSSAHRLVPQEQAPPATIIEKPHHHHSFSGSSHNHHHHPNHHYRHGPSLPENWNNHHPPPPRHPQHPELRDFIRRKQGEKTSSDNFYSVSVEYQDLKPGLLQDGDEHPNNHVIDDDDDDDDDDDGEDEGIFGGEDDQASHVSTLSRTGRCSIGTLYNESLTIPDGATPCCQNELD